MSKFLKGMLFLSLLAISLLMLWIFWLGQWFRPDYPTQSRNPPVLNPIYTIKDCIVTGKILTPDIISDKEYHDFYSRYMSATHHIERMDLIPTVELNHFPHDNREIYLLFSQGCDKKQEYAKKLIKAYHDSYLSTHTVELNIDNKQNLDLNFLNKREYQNNWWVE